VLLALWCLAGVVWGQEEPSSSEEVLWTGYTNDLLRLREGPSTEYPRLSTLPKDRAIEIYREQDGWLYVQAGERLGWVSGEFVRREFAMASSEEMSVTIEPSSPMVAETIVDDWSVERDGLLGRIRDLEISRQALETQLVEQPAAAGDAALEAELDELRGSYAEASELRVDLAAANAARENLAAELAAAREQIAQLTESLASVEATSQTLSERTAELEVMAEASGAQGEPSDGLDRELVALQEQLARSESEGDRLAEELNGARAEIVQLSSEMQALSERAQMAEMKAAEASTALSAPRGDEAHNVELKAQIDRQSSEIRDLGDRLAGTEAERDDLMTSLAAAEVRAEGLLAEVGELRTAAASAVEAPTGPSPAEISLQAELDLATERVASLESSLDTARLELAASQTAAAAPNVTVDTEKLAALEALEARLRRDLAASEQARTGIWARLESVRQENVSLKQQLASRVQRAPRVVAEAVPVVKPRPPYQEPLEPEPTKVATAAPLAEVVQPMRETPAPAVVENTEPLVAPVAPLTPPAAELVTVEEPLRGENDTEGVVLAINSWANAWASQDVDSYLGFYSGSFLPNSGADRNAWESQRRDRILRPASIDVVVQEITTQFVAGDRAITTFVQEYRSDNYSDTVSKTIEWVRDGDGWKIESEAAVPIG